MLHICTCIILFYIYAVFAVTVRVHLRPLQAIVKT
jgi:hypothetical protein